MWKRRLKRCVMIFACIALAGIVGIFGIDVYVRGSTAGRILTPEQAADLDADCILVLGCGVYADGTPSPMLSDRLRRGVELYELGAAPKLLMSGDHGSPDYNEVGAMKQYALDRGIDSSDIFMDHAGFSTYESMYRARDVFRAKKVVIVTQQYHLYRALYTARALGLDAYGVAGDYRQYAGQTYRNVREVLARVKDVATGAFKPKPTYLGNVIPITGDGNLTND